MTDHRSRDHLAIVVGALRLTSGVSFLVAPEAANRLWGDSTPTDATTGLLLRSMGYRDALIGGVLAAHGWSGRPTAPWFLASAGADAADLAGGLANHSRMSDAQRTKGLGGAVAGIGIGLLGATRARRQGKATT